MALDNLLEVYDENGVKQDYDILADDVKFSPDGKDLPTKLAEMQQGIDDAGQVNEIVMNGQHYTPTDKVINLGTVVGEQGPKGDKGDTGATGATGATGVQGPQGEKDDKGDKGDKGDDGADGKSAYQSYLDTTTDNPKKTEVEWLASLKGERGEQGIPGPQGNSGYTGAVGELEVVNNYTEGGAAKALSAEAGKDLATKCLPGYGSFADADEKAFANNVVFPWMLNDTDRDGNKITKMVWHIGNREFVDAIGAKVN